MLVSRRTHELVLQELHAERARANELQGIARAAEKHVEVLREEVAYLRELLDAKDHAILEMRREGFDPPPAPTAVVKGDDRPKLDAKIRAAIEAFADPGTSDHLLLKEQARRELARKARALQTSAPRSAPAVA